MFKKQWVARIDSKLPILEMQLNMGLRTDITEAINDNDMIGVSRIGTYQDPLFMLRKDENNYQLIYRKDKPLSYDVKDIITSWVEELNIIKMDYEEYAARCGIKATSNNPNEAWDMCRYPNWYANIDENTGEKSADKPRVFFDMDGTLAVFNKDATMEEVFTPGYFRDLEPISEMVDMAKAFNDDFEVFILSKSCYTAVDEKIEWLEKYMPFIPEDNYIFVPLEADKSKFIPNIHNNDILIDDYWKNLKEWKPIRVQCLNGINEYHPDICDYSIDIEKIRDKGDIYINSVLDDLTFDEDREKEADLEL